MSPFQTCIVVLLTAALAIAAWVFRYEVVPVGRGGDGTIVAGYQLDRWTGRVQLLTGARHTPVIERETTP